MCEHLSSLWGFVTESFFSFGAAVFKITNLYLKRPGIIKANQSCFKNIVNESSKAFIMSLALNVRISQNRKKNRKFDENVL